MTFVPFPQSDPYALAARACGAMVHRADLGCGTALVLARPGRRLVSRGPLWHPGASAEDRRRALRHLARRAGLTFATPDEALAGFGLLPLVTPFHHAVWDLSGDLLAGMAPKWRNRLRAGQARGVQVQAVPPARRASVLADLLAEEATQRLCRGYRSHSAAFTLALPGESLRLFRWPHAGRLAAGMAFVCHGGTATYHLGWAGAEARRDQVANVMLHAAATALAAEGIRWLDLGTVDTAAAPGLARFKLGTGAGLRRLGPTLLVLPG